MATDGETGQYLRWEKDVAQHDYAAATNYLSIRFGEDRAQEVSKKLQKQPVIHRRANDILRATQRDPLPLSDPGVLKDLKKVLAGKKLSPVLVAEGTSRTATIGSPSLTRSTPTWTYRSSLAEVKEPPSHRPLISGPPIRRRAAVSLDGRGRTGERRSSGSDRPAPLRHVGGFADDLSSGDGSTAADSQQRWASRATRDSKSRSSARIWAVKSRQRSSKARAKGGTSRSNSARRSVIALRFRCIGRSQLRPTCRARNVAGSNPARRWERRRDPRP